MQKWADEVDDQTFTFANLLRYYKKSVQFTPPMIPYPNSTNQQDPSAFSQSGGPLQVSFGHYNDPWSSWAQKGFRAVGQALINGFSSGRLIGTSYVAWTEDPINEQRSSSESSFLESTKATQTQLTVYKNTFAQKLIFSGQGNRAKGVVVAPEGDFGPNGRSYALFANRGTKVFITVLLPFLARLQPTLSPGHASSSYSKRQSPTSLRACRQLVASALP